MAVNKHVSIRVPVLNALQDMGIDIAKDVPVFTRWAAEAEKQIGSYYSLCKNIEVIKIKNCRAELPCDAAFVQLVILGEYGCECTDLFDLCISNSAILGAASTDTFLIIDSALSTQTASLALMKWEVQGNNIVFRGDHDGELCTVQYLGFKKDEHGFPMVLENHVGALVEYIMFKYCVRSKFSPVKMTDSDRMFHWREWMRQASQSRAEDAELSDSDRQEIIAMIHNPFGGYGMDVGMGHPSGIYGIY